MSINKKTSRWTEAGLLSDEQRLEIIAFEKARGAGRFMKGLYGLGAFSILAGILAIVASNWQIIPPNMKILVHLAINSILAYGIYTFDRQEKILLRELSIFGLMGLTLTLIALVGQLFQLNGSIAAALVLWIGLTTPFVMTYGHTKISLVPWIIGFISAIFAGLYEYIFPYLSNESEMLLTTSILVLLPITFVWTSKRIQKFSRPELQKILFSIGVFGSLIIANIACQLWYDDLRNFIDTPASYIAMLGTFGLSALMVLSLKPSKECDVIDTLDNTKLFLLGSLLFSALPMILPLIESDFLAAITFVTYWIFIGFIGQRSGKQGLVTASITLIAIRIYIVYIELFGSMLETGFGLVFSGLLLMAMVWGANKLNKNIKHFNLNGADHE